MEKFLDKKRPRSQNWDNYEKDLFMEFLKQEIPIIENKKKHTYLNRDKQNAWERICNRMEAHGNQRDIKRLKEQWQRMKLQAKRSIGIYRKQCNLTGGGPPPDEPSEIDWKIKDLLPHEFTEDTSGYDNDATCNIQTDTESESTQISNNVTHGEENFEPFASSSTGCSNDIVLVVTNTENCLEEEDCTEDDFTIENISEEPPAVPRTPKRAAIKKITAYEEKLYELNEKRMKLQIEQAREMHEVRMENERAHSKDARTLHELKVANEKEYHTERMKLLRDRRE